MVMEESDMELASENIPVPQVQEPVVDTVKRNTKSGTSRKPRLRKKALHASICNQMEFYFSDSNLNKDRFLSKLLNKSPYVNLDVFTKCNKLKELAGDHMITTSRIAKALQKSTILQVSEDGTKVCRITPIQTKENVDECTVYVQNLPPDADHDWLISIFSKYGKVDYVSIPRYQKNRKIKGFAFVEFDTPSHAQECLKIFRKKGYVLPSHVSPNEVLSISTFDKPQKNTILGVLIEPEAKTKNNEKGKVSKKEGKAFNEKEKISNEEEKASNEDTGTTDNECGDLEDNSKRSSKKRKYSSEKSFVTDENEIKAKKKKKEVNQSTTDQQSEKEKVSKEDSDEKDDTCDNEIDVADNDREDVKKEKYVPKKSPIADESNVKVRKRRITADGTITERQNEEKQVPKEESENKNNICNEIDTADNNRSSLRKRKLEKSCSRERDIKVTGNSNAENQEIPNKTRNKITEKKKRRYTINDTITAEDPSGEAVKEEHLCKEDVTNETNALEQTEKHSTKDLDMRNSGNEGISADEKKKKKNRKKRNKIQDDDICDKIGLQVMAKLDWKRLRNKYLDLQRYKMSQLKMHLRRGEGERGGIRTLWYKNDSTVINVRKIECKMDEDLPLENDNEKPNEDKSCGRVNYAPGLIVKIEMDEPCTSVQSFKMELKDNNSVKYIDVKADSCEAYIRCDTAEAAQTFTQKDCEGRRLTVLGGDEEKLYWDKIAEDRKEKLGQKRRVKQRGRKKLLKRAEKELGKCIKFDQD